MYNHLHHIPKLIKLAREAGKLIVKSGTKATAKEATKAAAKATSKETAKKASKETAKKATEETASITLKKKPRMDSRAFDRKAKAYKDLAERGKLVKSRSVRKPTETREHRKRILDKAREKFEKKDPEMFRKLKDRIQNMDADHLHDLQLGGEDDGGVMGLIDKRVNRSLGVQIRHQLKGLKDGTKIDKIIIKE